MIKSKYKKILLIISGILLCVGIVIALFKFTKRDKEVVGLLAPATLTDGEHVEYFGTFHDSTVENGLKAYASREMSISFKYPSDYLLFENQSIEGNDFHIFNIAPKEQALHTIARARAGFFSEGGPTMSITFKDNPKSLSLLEWMRTATSNSNFDPERDPDAARSLSSTTVAGIPALTWHSDFGYYANDYIAFVYHGWIVTVVTNMSDMGEKTDRDFHVVLSSIQLK